MDVSHDARLDDDELVAGDGGDVASGCAGESFSSPLTPAIDSTVVADVCFLPAPLDTATTTATLR